MTLPNGSNNPPISLSDINTEFGLGTNLGAYRGGLWGKADNTSGVFPAGAINVSDFYSTAKVAAGSYATVTTAGSGSFVVKPYRAITITAVGAGGGGGGGGGGTDNTACPGSAGGSGSTPTNNSTCGNVGDAWRLSSLPGSGGGGGGGANGGANGTPGTNYGGGNGGSGGAAGNGYTAGSGGAGGGGQTTSITLTNPVLGGTGPVSGSTISYLVGAGGALGGGGTGRKITAFFTCDNDGGRNGGSGTAGGNGSLAVSWTGQ